jgi:hypothetical protein
MNPLVFDPHEDHPRRLVGRDRKREWHRLDEIVDKLPHRGAVALHGLDGGPVVMGRVEVVPRHFVDTHRHHRFQPGIEPGGDVAAGGELVDVEDGRMGEVEDQRVPQRLVPLVVGGVVADEREEPLIDFTGLVKGPPQFLPLGGHGIGGGRIGRQQHRLGRCQRGRDGGEAFSGGRRGGWITMEFGRGAAHRALPAEGQNWRPDRGRKPHTLSCAAKPFTSSCGIGVFAPRSDPTTAPRWQLSPPQRALAKTPAAKSSAYRQAR